MTRYRVWGCSLLWILVPTYLMAAPPPWWTARSVLTSADADDYAVANQGQVKNIAKQAFDEMKRRGLVNDSSSLASLINSWSVPSATRDDYAAINIGQLKNVAEPFYAILVDQYGYSGQPFSGSTTSGARPWTGGTVDNYALANIGQVKNLFSFKIYHPNDVDNDDMLDSWEIANFTNLSATAFDDADGDGLSNLAEYLAGSNPNVAATAVSSSALSLEIYSP